MNGAEHRMDTRVSVPSGGPAAGGLNSGGLRAISGDSGSPANSPQPGAATTTVYASIASA
jgi:hypothetical protein